MMIPDIYDIIPITITTPIIIALFKLHYALQLMASTQGTCMDT